MYSQSKNIGIRWQDPHKTAALGPYWYEVTAIGQRTNLKFAKFTADDGRDQGAFHLTLEWE
jgi:hypothetical protein